MAVSHVSTTDIDLARQTIPAKTEQKTNSKPKAAGKTYVDMISDEKLKKFFSKYQSLGYITHYRDEESKTIKVICNDFEIIFNDFVATVGPRTDIEPSNKFDEFKFSCQVAGTSPDAVITSLLATELFGGLPYYTERKHQFDVNNIASLKTGAFKDITAPAVAAQMLSAEQPLMKKKYGSDSLEDIAEVMNSVKSR